MRHLLARVAVTVCCAWTPLSFADGPQWLIDQAQADGSIARPTDIATSQQATIETLKTSALLGFNGPTIVAARQFTESNSFANTAQLARRIIARYQAGQNGGDLLTTLISYQNSDGGFGDQLGYSATVLDTALALDALASAGITGQTPSLALSYLLNTQQSDGSWLTGANGPSVYLTARALIALWPYRNQFNLSAAIDSARSYLLNQRNVNQLWSEPYLSSLALVAITPTLIDKSVIQGSLDALAATQLADGSFGQDVYVTALALRVLRLATLPSEDEISISGRVLENDTGQPLQGALINLAGPTNITVSTANTGRFTFNDLAPGSYTLSLSREGYFPVNASTNVRVGDQVEFGDIALVKDTGNESPGATTGTLRGVITDAVTGQPLPGANVSIEGGSSVSTLSDGSYQITNVPSQPVTLSAGAPGFRTVTTNVTVPQGGIAVFSSSLLPEDNQVSEGATVSGIVTDAATGNPLENVAITLTGDISASAQTDAQGRYEIPGLGAGQIRLTASLPTYQSAIANTELLENSRVFFSPSLYLIGQAPVNSNTASVTGTVLNSTTNQPIAGVAVAGSWGDSTAQVTTDANGVFSIEGVDTNEILLNFSASGFVSAFFAVDVALIDENDIGQVRLRREGLEQALPDLTVSAEYSINTNRQNLKSDGAINARVKNIGTAGTVQPISLLAYIDRDGDGNFSADNDLILGQTESDASLPVDTDVQLQIPVEGYVNFRDEPIRVLVDHNKTIPELNENNNSAASLNFCVGLPQAAETISPSVKWRWSGSPAHPNARSVFGPVAVAQLMDDNDDGLVNDQDTPDIIFPASNLLTAVSGDTGTTIWQASQSVASLASAAVGDIDLDGFVEIVIPNSNRTRLLAFEHDGQLKWSTPTGPTFSVPRDGVALADLDGDGAPEIIHGRRAYSATGTLLWEGTRDYGGQSNYGMVPIVADVDNDGDPEIVAGRSLYSATGATRWHVSQAVSDGFNAVGNFDEDEFAEIVLVASGRVYLLEHTGQIKWGPVSIPGGGVGGPPTIGDVDGDGEVEIGVAGRQRYTVFETDGSIKWSVRNFDASSSRTGSSVFDLNGDGQVEVLYADERFFYIFDGATGSVLSRIDNVSGTVLEYPVIADIDNDGHGEILVGSSGGNTIGLRAFEGGIQEWLPTRAIWNQHSYHITNINDDGSIPAEEESSWLTHNTYRLNTFLDRNPLDQADLSASFIQVTDNGLDQPLTLSVRVGNAGLLTTPNNVETTFYDGDPANGGLPLGTVRVPELAPGQFADVELTGVNGLVPSSELYALVDSGSSLEECDEINNIHHVPVSAAMALGGIIVSTDASLYGPGQDATLNASVTNTGSLASEFIVELSIEDPAGNVVINFAPVMVGSLNSGDSAQTSQVWNTGTTLSGNYILRGRLSATDSDLVGESTASFAIGNTNDGVTPAATLRTTTDMSTYNTTDLVQIDNLVSNTSSNTTLQNTRLSIEVFEPSGELAHSTIIPLNQLSPSGQQQVTEAYTLQAAAEGQWLVQGTVLDAQDTALASDSASFTVAADPLLSLQGDVNAALPEINRREIQTCTDNVTNIGDLPLNDRALRQLVVDISNDTVLIEQTATVDLNINQSLALTPRTFDTTNYAPGPYACILQADVNGEWQTLDFAEFQLLPALIQFDAELTPGERGRLLVLLDNQNEPANNNPLCNSGLSLQLEVEFEAPLSPDATVQVQLLDALGTLVDVESFGLGSADGEINANTGQPVDLAIPEISADKLLVQVIGNDLAGLLGDNFQIITTIQDGAQAYTLESGRIDLLCDLLPTVGALLNNTFSLVGIELFTNAGARPGDGIDSVSASAQRAWLEMLLDQAGWSYTLASNSEDFARELRGGGYAAYALLGEYQALDEQIQAELREAVFRGEGLLVVGRPDSYDRVLDEALGIKYKGLHLNPQGVALEASALSPGANLLFAENGNSVQRARLTGAQRLGRLIRAGSPVQDAIVTAHNFGLGRSVYAGFDLLAEATLAGQGSGYASLLSNALTYIHPDQSVAVAGRVTPLHLSVDNRGAPTPVSAQIGADAGRVVASSAGEIDAQGQLTWPFDLAEDASADLDFWLGIPNSDSPVTVSAQLTAGEGQEQFLVTEISTLLQPVVLPGLTASIDSLQAYVDAHACHGLLCILQNLLPTSAERALTHLKTARSRLNQNQIQAALEALTAGADDLADVDNPAEIQTVRLYLSNAIIQTSGLLH